MTATPVNKNIEDLIRIIELLDVDNLEDSDFEHYKEIKESKVKSVSEEGRRKLKGFIDNFLVRRTKSELNKLIDRNPEKYKNRGGKECRFPKVENPVYDTLETTEDKQLVEQIATKAENLYGLTYLIKFEPPHFLVNSDEDKKKYIDQRKNGAKNLAIYNIRSNLRSSKMALLEHLLGSKKVNKVYKLNSNKNPTGNIIEKIKKIIKKAELPPRNFKSAHFPEWLTDIDSYTEACTKEIETYQEIGRLAEKLTERREEGKVEEIRKLARSHRIVIAFDSTLITLDLLNKMLKKKEKGKVESFVATGTNKATVEKVLKICSPGSRPATNTVIFCSDIMSEGVNLQSASALILLDIPSVVRLVEQRIGRIDRMDTDHKVIKVLWPNDSEEYSLKGDKRLVETSDFVNSTLGGNYDLPAILRERHLENVGDIESIKKEVSEKRGESGWEGSRNFFKPIQDLRNKFIPDELYKTFKGVSSKIKTCVSFYNSANNWCFICTRGNLKESPKWFFLEKNSKPLTNFIDVAKKLNDYLPFTEDSRLCWKQDRLNLFLKEFRECEKELLPVKKRRALEVAAHILKKKLTLKNNPQKYRSMIKKNLSLFDSSSNDEITDYHSLSDLWIDVLQPELDKKRNLRTNRRKALNLNALEGEWRRIKIEEDTLKSILDKCTTTHRIDDRIAACIVGVKET